VLGAALPLIVQYARNAEGQPAFSECVAPLHTALAAIAATFPGADDNRIGPGDVAKDLSPRVLVWLPARSVAPVLREQGH